MPPKKKAGGAKFMANSYMDSDSILEFVSLFEILEVWMFFFPFAFLLEGKHLKNLSN